jgi:putative transposase
MLPGQYTALVFGQTSREAGIELSTGRKGRAHDNAVTESFFATLKKDLVNRRSWPRRQELRTAVFDYIETFYNPVRLHSTLGYLSPADYQRRHANGLIMAASEVTLALPA